MSRVALWPDIMMEEHIYLLRVWLEEREAEPFEEQAGLACCWRATLEDPRTGRRWGFTEARSLAEFLAGEAARPMTVASQLADSCDPPPVILLDMQGGRESSNLASAPGSS